MSIKRRTVYYDYTDDIVRFWDWATVETTIGHMVEPFHPGNRHATNTPFIEFDPTDEIARIDSIERHPIDKHMLLLSSGDQVHGGVQLPRDGR